MNECVSFRWNKAAAISLLLFSALETSPLLAVDIGQEVQVHGFISQAAALSNHNKVGGDSSDGIGTSLREIGGNFSWRPKPDWLVSAQALMRWAGETDEGDLRLDYGFLDHTMLSSDYRLGVQMGRIKNPYGFYNSTRDVAHTRPGVLLPQSIYLDRVRDFIIAGPGVSFYGEDNSRHSSLSWQLTGFRPQMDGLDVEYLFLGGDRPGKMEGRPSWFFQSIFDLQGGRWRLGTTVGEVVATFNSATPLIGNGDNRNQLAVLSLNHNGEYTTITAEYAQIRAKSKDYGNLDPILNEDNTLEAWYVQGTWRFQPNWQAYLRRDVLYMDKNDKNGTKFSAKVPTYPPHSRYSKDWTLGVRRDLGQLALFAEAHLIDGSAWLSPLDTPLANREKDWNLFLLQAAYRF